MPNAVKSRNNPLSGALYFVRGLRLILRPGVKRFVIVPLLVNVLLFSVAIYFGYTRFELLMQQFTDWLPDWLNWLQTLLWPLFLAAALLVLFFGFGLVGNLVAAPFNGLLAEAVEKDLTGSPLDLATGYRRMLADLFRSLLSELRKLLYFALWSIPLLILFLIPVLNLAAPVLWMLFTAWMLMIEYADYPMANHGLLFPQQRRLLRSRRMLSLGFGGMTTVALMIPLLNFVVIPAGVAGATALWVEQLRDNSPAAAA